MSSFEVVSEVQMLKRGKEKNMLFLTWNSWLATGHFPVFGEILASQNVQEVFCPGAGLIVFVNTYSYLTMDLENIELVSYSHFKKVKLVGRQETPLVPMQKGKHWNAKYRPKPQVWSLHQDVFKARHCWGNSHNMHVWSISLPMRITFFKDDLDSICYSACHLYHEIPRLKPRKTPKEIVSHKQQNRESQEEEGNRRKTIWGQNLSAAQPEARTEKTEHPGASPQVTKPGTSALTAKSREPSSKTPPNTQKRSWLTLRNCNHSKCQLYVTLSKRHAVEEKKFIFPDPCKK